MYNISFQNLQRNKSNPQCVTTFVMFFYLYFVSLMDSLVLQLCYESWWETLADGRMEYVNDNNTIQDSFFNTTQF